jgi:hypothetical protein
VDDIPPVHSMTFDQRTGLLIWTDGHQIWSIYSNGQNQKRLGSTSGQITALSAYSGFLYLANSTDQTIQRTRPLNSILGFEILHKDVKDVRALLVAHSYVPMHSNVNALKECKSSAERNVCICMPGDEYKCLCPDQEEPDLRSGKCQRKHLV